MWRCFHEWGAAAARRGHVSQTIAHLEAMEAEIYVAGHGDPGTLADVRTRRTQLASQFQHARECFERGMNYDEALQAFAEDGVPLDFQRLIILASGSSPAGGPRPPTLPVRTTSPYWRASPPSPSCCWAGKIAYLSITKASVIVPDRTP